VRPTADGRRRAGPIRRASFKVLKSVVATGRRRLRRARRRTTVPSLGAHVQPGVEPLPAFATAHLTHRAVISNGPSCGCTGQSRGAQRNVAKSKRGCTNGELGGLTADRPPASMMRTSALRRSATASLAGPSTAMPDGAETWRCALTVGEAHPEPAQPPRADGRPDLDNATAFVGNKTMPAWSTAMPSDGRARRPAGSHGGDESGRGDQTDGAVAGVGDVDVAGAIDGDSAGCIEPRRARGPVGEPVPLPAIVRTCPSCATARTGRYRYRRRSRRRAG
jgi:hypothetical protein